MYIGPWQEFVLGRALAQAKGDSRSASLSSLPPLDGAYRPGTSLSAPSEFGASARLAPRPKRRQGGPARKPSAQAEKSQRLRQMQVMYGLRGGPPGSRNVQLAAVPPDNDDDDDDGGDRGGGAHHRHTTPDLHAHTLGAQRTPLRPIPSGSHSPALSPSPPGPGGSHWPSSEWPARPPPHPPARGPHHADAAGAAAEDVGARLLGWAPRSTLLPLAHASPPRQPLTYDALVLAQQERGGGGSLRSPSASAFRPAPPSPYAQPGPQRLQAGVALVAAGGSQVYSTAHLPPSPSGLGAQPGDWRQAGLHAVRSPPSPAQRGATLAHLGLGRRSSPQSLVPPLTAQSRATDDLDDEVDDLIEWTRRLGTPTHL